MYKNFSQLMATIKNMSLINLLIRKTFFVLAVLTALLIILIRPFVKIKLIQLYSSRMGQYGINTHLMLCALESSDFPEEKKYKHFYYTQHWRKICNTFIHKMFSRTITILPFPSIFWAYVDRILILILKEKYNSNFKTMFEDSEGGNDRWGYFEKFKKIFFNFTEDEKHVGEELKRKMGIPDGAPYVCLVVRDTMYSQVEMPDTQWDVDDYRNSTIENYIPAIKFLIDNGFYVVRMGKHVERTLDIGNSKFIDYPNHEARSDFMDIYLSAHCFFFISTGTGIDCVPQIFDRKLITTNVYFTETRTYLNRLFTIHKNILCTKTQTLVSFEEGYQDYVYYYLSGRYAGQNPRSIQLQGWKEKHWVLIENTPDEILSAVQDTLHYLLIETTESKEMKDMQKLFWKCCPYPLAPGKTSYDEVRLKIAPSFLKRHYQLLIPASIKKPCEID